MSEINCPDEYIKDLFISDRMRGDYVVKKVKYRRKKNFFLLIYRGLLFHWERRFVIFLDVTLCREINRNVGIHIPSEAVVVFVIRARLVLPFQIYGKVILKKEIYAETLQQ